jgi:acetyl esterase
VRDFLKRTAIRAAMAQDFVVRTVARGRSQGIDAGLDRQVAAALEYQRLARLPSLESMTPEAARVFAEANLAVSELDPQPMAEIVDTRVGEQRTPVRIFVPPDAGDHWLVWLHGGGGVIGSIDGAERVTRYLAARTRCTVASVGYRLAPEDPHPAAIEDACDAWQELVARVPARGRVVAGGDSFGGFLTAHIDRYARHTGVRQPDLQLMFYPLLDLTLSSPSIERYADGYLLTKAMMTYFRSHYLSAPDEAAPGSPWFWDDVSGAAPAIVVTAGFDPLVDEGDAWAARLRAAGVTVRHRRCESLVHGFLSLAGIVRAAHRTVDDVCDDIVEMLS